MSQSRRDFFLIALPPLVIALVYFVTFDKTLRDEKEKALGPAKQLPTNNFDAAIRTIQENKKRVQADINILENQKKEHETSLEAILQPMTNPQHRADQLQDFSSLLAAHRLRLTEENPGHLRSLTDSLRILADFIKKRGVTNPPELRIMEIQGSYLDMLGALEEMNLRNIQVVPVNLSMHSTKPGERTRTWTLILWV